MYHQQQQQQQKQKSSNSHPIHPIHLVWYEYPQWNKAHDFYFVPSATAGNGKEEISREKNWIKTIRGETTFGRTKKITRFGRTRITRFNHYSFLCESYSY